MKTVRNTLIILISLFVFTACSKKSDEVNPVTLPAPSAELAGSYNVIGFRFNNGSQENLPNGRKIVIKFGYVSDTKALLLINDNTASDPTTDTDYGQVNLARVGRRIDISAGAIDLGSYDNGTVELEFSQSNGMVRFIGKRQ
jgi:hypothetical protein